MSWLAFLLLLLYGAAGKKSRRKGLPSPNGSNSSSSSSNGSSNVLPIRPYQSRPSLEPTLLPQSIRALIIVPIALHNLHRRMLHRSTYLQFAPAELFSLRFLVGHPAGSLRDAGHLKTLELLQYENNTYHDMVLVDWHEDRPSTYKRALACLHWAAGAAASGGYDYVVKAEEDTFIHVLQLYAKLLTLPRARAFWGNKQAGSDVDAISFMHGGKAGGGGGSDVDMPLASCMEVWGGGLWGGSKQGGGDGCDLGSGV